MWNQKKINIDNLFTKQRQRHKTQRTNMYTEGEGGGMNSGLGLIYTQYIHWYSPFYIYVYNR